MSGVIPTTGLTVIASLCLLLAACSTSQSRGSGRITLDIAEVEQLADRAYENDNLADGEQLYGILTREVPENALYWFRLANIFARTGRNDAAVEAYRATLARDPQLGKAWYNLGLIYLRQAGDSFNEMQGYIAPDDPLSRQGKESFDGVVRILDQDQTDP